VIDVLDSVTSSKVFGYPASGHPEQLFKVRVVMLIEAGTHLIVKMCCPYRMGGRYEQKSFCVLSNKK